MDRRGFIGRALGALACVGLGPLAAVTQKKVEDGNKPYRGPVKFDEIAVPDMFASQRADLLETQQNMYASLAVPPALLSGRLRSNDIDELVNSCFKQLETLHFRDIYAKAIRHVAQEANTNCAA